MSQENLSSGFATKYDSNWRAQLLKLARGLKFWIKKLDIVLSKVQTTKTLIRLCGCAGRSVSLLFVYGINRLCHDVPPICLYLEWLQSYAIPPFSHNSNHFL